jgi:tetratricopeptide (TPR) repeat protein
VPQNAPAIKPVERREDLLDKFLKQKPIISRPKQEFYSPEKAGKRSDTLSNKIVTETLANIYYKQGNYTKAIEAYEQLQLKFPEKMSYFANLIEKIKKESIS